MTKNMSWENGNNGLSAKFVSPAIIFLLLDPHGESDILIGVTSVLFFFCTAAAKKFLLDFMGYFLPIFF